MGGAGGGPQLAGPAAAVPLPERGLAGHAPGEQGRARVLDSHVGDGAERQQPGRRGAVAGDGVGAPVLLGRLVRRGEGQHVTRRGPPGDPGLRVTPVGEPVRRAAPGVGHVDLGVPVPPARPRDPGAVAGEARVTHRHVVGGQPPGPAALGRREPHVAAGREGEQVTANVRVTQVTGRHQEASRGGSGGRTLDGPVAGSAGTLGGCFSSASSTSRTAVSSCGSCPAAQSSGVISTSMSGSTP